tara:strand:- start:112 stop:495 length:384 start_codon:yes stop_codon:yes gene_type:complete
MASEIKLIDKKFVGNPVDIGTSLKRYEGFLMSEEKVLMEYKGIRDAALFTNKRLIVIDPQGLLGKKVQITSIPWRSISAFSVENSGTFDLDAELKVCGSGFGICELQFTKGVDVKAINEFITKQLLS